MLRLIILTLVISTLWGCASIKPPPGGDEDKTPPTIDTTFPSIGQTNVPKDIKPRILFEQNVERSTFTQSVTLTPYMPGVIKYDWSGYDEVELELPEPLRDSTTYILTIGRDLKTRRAGTLTAPIQIIFSTGPTLDSGVISGQIFPSFLTTGEENFTTMFVFAYDISVRSPDTLNMSATRPDYITQPTSSGAFELRALKVGHKYRIVAVGDEFRNRLYDHTVDSYGIPTGDVMLSGNSAPPIFIRTVPKVDTSRPKLEDVEVRDLYHFRAKFNKAIDTAAVLPSNFELVPEGQQSPVLLLAAYKEDPEKRPAVVTLVPAERLRIGANYTLHAIASTIRDTRGQTMRQEGASVTFTVGEVPDTFSTPIHVQYSIMDSARDISRTPRIKLTFSEAINTAALDRVLTLYDSTGKVIPIEIQPGDATHFTIIPKDTLLPKAFYRLETDGKLIASPVAEYATKTRDTIYRARFFTVDPKDFGSVSGEITYPDSVYNPAAHRIVVQLINAETHVVTRKVLSEGRTTYAFETVSPGRYRLRAWLSSGSDAAAWNGGEIAPFRFAMPTGEYPELIDVRSRWTVDDVNFELK